MVKRKIAQKTTNKLQIIIYNATDSINILNSFMVICVRDIYRYVCRIRVHSIRWTTSWNRSGNNFVPLLWGKYIFFLFIDFRRHGAFKIELVKIISTFYDYYMDGFSFFFVSRVVYIIETNIVWGIYKWESTWCGVHLNSIIVANFIACSYILTWY